MPEKAVEAAAAVVNAQPDMWELWGYDLQTMALGIAIFIGGYAFRALTCRK